MTAANRARRSLRWGPILALAVMVGLVPSATGADTPAGISRLEAPMADVAVLEPPADGDPGMTPMLLVLDADGSAADLARVSILRRAETWERVGELELDLERDDLSARWLIGLGGNRFALVATSPPSVVGSGYSVIVGLDVRGDGIVVEAGRSRIDRAVEDAGAADVDGLGTNELVLGMRPSFEPAGSCGMASLAVVDGASLAIRRSIDLPGRIGRGAVGDWDGAPGDDLLVYASPDCPPGGATRTRLVVIRLTDGTETAVSDGLDRDVARYPAPVRFQVDGEDRHRALAISSDGLAIVDGTGPAFTIPSSGSVPLVAGPAADAEGPATRIAWWDEEGLHAERIRPGPRGLLVGVGRTDLARETVDAGRWELLTNAIWNDMDIHGRTSAWQGDVVDAGCPDLILPGAILPCGSEELRPGATWLATRPVAVMPIEGRRGMLVAAGLGWDPNVGLPASPTPWAAAPDGWWRHGPSTPFAVSEVRASDVTYFQEFPSPKATIEKATARDGTTLLPGFTGTRLFVSVTPLADGEEGPDVAPDRIAGLATGAGPGGLVTTVRVPVPPGNESGRDGSFTTLALGGIERSDGAAISRWALRVVPINDWGEVGLPVVRTITRDAVGPTLNLETPFTSPVWPFLARLPGRAEPGSTVSLPEGALEVDERGRFTVVTHLAPWPQTIRISATDASGNTSVTAFSVVGGIDYRRFPWALIIALTLLGVVAARGLASAGRNRGGGVEATAWSTGTLDEASVPEIEDLPPGSGLARR